MKRILDPTTRFTEEIIAPKGQPLSDPFAIRLRCNCNPSDPNSTNSRGSKNVHACYYDQLAKDMESPAKVAPSKRLSFVLYQASIREQPIAFLDELKDFVTDNRRFFDDRYSDTARGYFNAITEAKSKLAATFPAKINAAMNGLQKSRGSKNSSSISNLLKKDGYRIILDDERLIADHLEEKGLINATRTKDGVFATLTAKGVMFDPNAQPHSEGDLSNAELLAEITARFDLLMANQSVLIAQGQFDLSKMNEEISEAVETLNQKAGGKSKSAIRRIADSYLGKLVLSETIKRGIIKPVLDGAEKSLLELAEAITPV